MTLEFDSYTNNKINCLRSVVTGFPCANFQYKSNLCGSGIEYTTIIALFDRSSLFRIIRKKKQDLVLFNQQEVLRILNSCIDDSSESDANNN